jgi:hypothetical protein
MCCVAVLTVLGLWLGTGGTRLHLDEHLSASINHRVAVATPVVRTAPADDPATPAGLLVLVVALTGMLVRSRRPVTVARSHPGPALGRAPPSNLLQA